MNFVIGNYGKRPPRDLNRIMKGFNVVGYTSWSTDWDPKVKNEVYKDFLVFFNLLNS